MRVKVERRGDWWVLTQHGRKVYGSKLYASEESAQRAAQHLRKRTRKK